MMWTFASSREQTALVWSAETRAAIQNEILRQHMEQHPVALQAHLGGHFDGVARSSGRDFVRPAEFVQAAALRALHFHAADAERYRIHRNACAALSIRSRRRESIRPPRPDR